MRIGLGLVVLCGIASAAQAQNTLYMQNMFSDEVGGFHYADGTQGMYTQDWTASYLGSHDNGREAVYVEAGGKLGDFAGVLAIDCIDASQSSWLALGGSISEDSVPVQAIAAIRQLACRDR